MIRFFFPSTTTGSLNLARTAVTHADHGIFGMHNYTITMRFVVNRAPPFRLLLPLGLTPSFLQMLGGWYYVTKTTVRYHLAGQSRKVACRGSLAFNQLISIDQPPLEE